MESKEVDIEFLMKIKNKLKNNNNLIIDEYSENLSEIKLKDMPAKNRQCPSCDSKQRYKKCCEPKDLLEKAQVLDKIEEILMKKEN